jgi:hypothetical protein
MRIPFLSKDDSIKSSVYDLSKLSTSSNGETIIHLEEDDIYFKGLDKPKTMKQREELKRVDPKKLELAYCRDDVAYNGVNLYVNTLQSVDYEFKAKNPKIVEYMKKWDKTVNFYFSKYSCFKHITIYGNAWGELLWGKTDGVDYLALDFVDPKSMDFLRDNMSNILYDNYGRPSGYCQRIPMNYTKTIPNNREVMSPTLGRAMLIKTNEMAHFTWNTVGDCINGIGLIEPQYDIIRIKKNVEKAFGQSSFRFGFPTPIIYVGDKEHPAKQEEIDKIVKDFAEKSEKSVLGYDHRVRVEMMEPKTLPDMTQNLEYYIDRQVTVLGAPKALVTGSGEATNRSTLETQLSMFERNIRMILEKVGNSFEQEVFSILAEKMGWDEIPQIVWTDLSIRSLSDMADRLARYQRAGMMKYTPETENRLRELEGLPLVKGGQDAKV